MIHCSRYDSMFGHIYICILRYTILVMITLSIWYYILGLVTAHDMEDKCKDGLLIILERKQGAYNGSLSPSEGDIS